MKAWFARVLDAIEEERPSEQRRAPRTPVNRLFANYFVGGGEIPFRVADVSLTGAFIESPAKWAVGTLIVVMLQVDSPERADSVDTRTVHARVARLTANGFGVEFLFPDKAQRLDFHRFIRCQCH